MDEFKKMTCPDCGKEMRVNSYTGGGESIIDYFYECPCGCMVESDGTRTGDDFKKIKNKQIALRDKEIYLVQKIGDLIGYGNMMDIASALWAEELEKSYNITTGAFIPAVSYDLKNRHRKRYAQRQEMVKRECRQAIARLGGGEV